MKPLMIAVVLGFLITTPTERSAQLRLKESQAITHVQKTAAVQLDPALPNRPFGKWFEQLVGNDAGVTWQLSDCGEKADVADGDAPACVEATAMLPAERVVVAMTIIGTFRQGITGKPRVRFIVVEDFGQLKEVKRLSELPDLLRRPPVKPRRIGKRLPLGRASWPPVWVPPSPPRFETAGDVPRRWQGLAEEEEPPPPPPAPAPEGQRVSQGMEVLTAITKVTPIYPAVARQINAAGEVKVRVTVDEEGTVVEAIAVSGHPLLQSAAEEAARKWVFKPATLNGRPVRVQSILSFKFER